MAKPSRDKGKRGEREVAEILRDHGFDAYRDGRLDEDVCHNVGEYHFEVKRRERLDLPEWTRQAEADAGARIPVVVYRRSREAWRASLPFHALVELLAIKRRAFDVIENSTNGREILVAYQLLGKLPPS